eukprot:gene8529-353_t
MENNTSVLVEEITLLEEALLIAQTRARYSDDKKTEIEEQHENLIQEFESYKNNMKDFIKVLTKTFNSTEDSTLLKDWLNDFEEETNFLKEPNENIFESAEKLKLIIENKINNHLEKSRIKEKELSNIKESKNYLNETNHQPFTLTEKLINLKHTIEVFITGLISSFFKLWRIFKNIIFGVQYGFVNEEYEDSFWSYWDGFFDEE